LKFGERKFEEKCVRPAKINQTFSENKSNFLVERVEGSGDVISYYSNMISRFVVAYGY